MARVWRILSIDGGGIRGIIPANILAVIEERTQKPVAELFDLIAGTSTGGILALGLTKPDQSGSPAFSARRMCELYEENIPRIFHRPRSWLRNLVGPKYKSFSLQKVLMEQFSDCRLKSALADVVIPCYDIENRLPYVFRSRSARLHSEDDFYMRDVALATSASPTLFHPVSIARHNNGRIVSLVDGGVFANNPAIIALSEAKSQLPDKDDEYFVVSLGTGKSTLPLSDELISLWGYVQWSRPMLELVMESTSESVHQQIRHFLPSSDSQHYYRLQIELPEHSDPAIDNASRINMQGLSLATKEFCSTSKGGAELDGLCTRLLRLTDQTATSRQAKT